MPGGAVEQEQAAPVLGFHGKVPTHGDFVRRHLPRWFVDPWDQWLQQAVANSRSKLGDGWLDSYLTSPIWRFALAPGVCGDQSAAGVLMPSVDSVGRYFPITIAALHPEPCNPFALAAWAEGWFARAEDLALSCLDKGFLLAAFESKLEALGPLPADACAAPNCGRAPAIGSRAGLACSLDPAAAEGGASRFFPDLLDRLAEPVFAPYGLWWTTGSTRIGPSLVIYSGLPPPEDFTWFLGAANAGKAP